MARYRGPLLVSALGLSILYLILGTMPQMPGVLIGVPDFVVHAGAYLLLTVVVGATAVGWRWPRPGAVAFLYGVGHGALLEFVQIFTPPRRAELKDLAVDAAAALVGAAVFRWRGR
jgi:VanZ family protein